MNSGSTQDWTTVVLHKTAKQKTAGLNTAQAINKARLSGVQVVAEKKIGEFFLCFLSISIIHFLINKCV
jgi:hypothetical protein